jgi:membrane fusion protein, copper/silver efflux system
MSETSPDDPGPAATPGKSRRRFGWSSLLLLMIASSAVASGATYAWLSREHNVPVPPVPMESTKASYVCPMHPTIIQDHPGECPICGMKLVKSAPDDSKTSRSAAARGKDKPLYYRSPMNPRQTSPEPKKDEMGMDYVPVYADDVGGDSTVKGFATVDIDPARQQLIGLKLVAVSHGTVGGAWRTVGRVAVDETRVRHINLKVPTFVEQIFVDFIGKAVKKGEPLFSVYSPELFSAQEELLLALRTQKTLSRSATMTGEGDALVAAARRKLELWDVPDTEIQRIEQTGTAMKSITFYSPISGVVTKKDVVEGMKLEAGAMPYEIVDLSQVWVFAEVYESELRHVKVGMAATMTLKAFPNREFKGKVSFLDPLLDPLTRTVKVRLVFPNPTGELRPEMFGEVTLQGAVREGLRIPVDAVIESGTKSIVFVSLGEGKFQPRQVETGDRDGTNVEVLSGLDDADQVVTRANFLIDSESRLRSSLAALDQKESGPIESELDPPASTLRSPAEEPRASTLRSPAKEPRASTLRSRAEEPRASTQKALPTAPAAAPDHAGHPESSPQPPQEKPTVAPVPAPDHSGHAGHPGHAGH